MRPSLFFLAFATAFLSSTASLPPNDTVISGVPLKGPNSLRGNQDNGDRFLRIHETIRGDKENNGEERGGGINNFLNNFRYQSQGAHGAEDLNQVTMARYYLQENPTLFNPMRTDSGKRYNTYAIWRSMKYHSDAVGRAMQLNGYSANEVMAFVKEYKKFQPAKLSIT
ncbi:hypothetical protein PHMEG_00026517 [Phytophthora megakarya]|uniref:RxLR effector protein n=1 Tax=Phytophthora megakarya TaxID=4795 RepID=A0A225V9J1_9STRA|nr:hypothetical protein PHMEG_00026517 [Phytophthora megakarya]